MEILEFAIQTEGGVGKLSKKLGFKHPSTVSNWRLRKSLPRWWEHVLMAEYNERMVAASRSKRVAKKKAKSA